MKLWNLATGQEESTLEGYEETVKRVATRQELPTLSPDGKTLTGRYQNGVGLLEPVTGRLLLMLSVPSQEISDIAFSSNGKILAAGYPGKVKLWHAATEEEVLARTEE